MRIDRLVTILLFAAAGCDLAPQDSGFEFTAGTYGRHDEVPVSVAAAASGVYRVQNPFGSARYFMLFPERVTPRPSPGGETPPRRTGLVAVLINFSGDSFITPMGEEYIREWTMPAPFRVGVEPADIEISFLGVSRFPVRATRLPADSQLGLLDPAFLQQASRFSAAMAESLNRVEESVDIYTNTTSLGLPNPLESLSQTLEHISATDFSGIQEFELLDEITVSFNVQNPPVLLRHSALYPHTTLSIFGGATPALVDSVLGRNTGTPSAPPASPLPDAPPQTDESVPDSGSAGCSTTANGYATAIVLCLLALGIRSGRRRGSLRLS
jgi:hypothetical protein